MADPRLNSLHLEPVRRQEYRHAREVLLRARGDQTIYTARDSDSQNFGHTAIHKVGGKAETELMCWLSDGEFLYPLQVGVNTVGRSSDNDVVLDDAYASRRHCAILVHSDKTCELHDTASKNGTCVNGARIAGPIILKAGDEIRISHLQFVFLTRDGGPDASSSSATLGV
jgi:hypothetical protein